MCLMHRILLRRKWGKLGKEHQRSSSLHNLARSAELTTNLFNCSRTCQFRIWTYYIHFKLESNFEGKPVLECGPAEDSKMGLLLKIEPELAAGELLEKSLCPIYSGYVQILKWQVEMKKVKSNDYRLHMTTKLGQVFSWERNYFGFFIIWKTATMENSRKLFKLTNVH